MSHRWLILPLLGAFCLGASDLQGQDIPHVAGGPGWVLRSSASVDLWYHGLAVVGYDGLGPLPLYAREYAARVTSAKEAEGRYPTMLDRLRTYFRIAFATDSAYEIFHLLPLSFESTEPEPILAALAAAARGETREEPYARILSDVLKKKSQREIAGQFITALDAEWRAFLKGHWEADSIGRNAYLAEAGRQWETRIAPGLRAYLTNRRLERGIALASPALGPEGRVVLSELDGSDDHVMAVQMPVDMEDPSMVLFAMVRELCYPAASQEVERWVVHPDDRVTVARLSSQAAVRCGAMLLDARAADLAGAYRRSYVRAAMLDPDRVTFENAFPVDAQLLKKLRRELRIPEEGVGE